MNTVLFDLDGTLLPMVQDEFVQHYLSLLGKKGADYGYQPQTLVAALWRGTGAMIQNDGSASNYQRFWDIFEGELGQDIRRLEPVFEDFYQQEFQGARKATQGNPLARQVIDTLQAKGYLLALATNPLFPAVAVHTRLSWVGLHPQDFAYITDYRNSRFCKPQLGYFQDVLAKLGKEPADCLMVGNSIVEDLAARQLGIAAYLITDCLEGQGDISGVPQGSFKEFAAYVAELPSL